MIEMRSPYKRALAMVTDSVCAMAAPVLTRGRRMPAALPRAPRVLLIRCDHIGDATMATTFVSQIREQTGASRLDILAGPWAADLFRAHPAVDTVISYAAPWWLSARSASLRQQLHAWKALPGVISRIRGGEYDVGIDLRGDLRQIMYFLVLGGCTERVSTNRTGGEALLTRYSQFDANVHELQKTTSVLQTLGIDGERPQSFPLPLLSAPLQHALASATGERGLIALANQGNQTSRSWPLERAIAFAKLLTSAFDVGVVYLGGPNERQSGELFREALGDRAVNLAGRTTLVETVTVLQQMRALVTIDSGPMHLGGMAGIPTLALFGAGDPVQFGPWSMRHAVVRPHDKCHCPLATTCSQTSDGHGQCMDTISPRDVLAALRELIPETFSSHQRASATLLDSGGTTR